METKDLRFIDSKYNELFRIKDGESVTVTFSDGSMSDRQCTYIDDYHTKIGYNVFHICEFAELMERGGRFIYFGGIYLFGQPFPQILFRL